MKQNECYDEAALRGYFDNALSDIELQQISKHLSGCSDCQERLRELQALSAQVTNILELHIDVPDTHQALSRLQAARRSTEILTRVQSTGPKTIAGHTPAVRANPTTVQPHVARRLMRLALTGLGAALVIALAYGLSALFASRVSVLSPAQNNIEDAPFLPSGMVRHMVLIGTSSVEGVDKNASPTVSEEHHEEFWLTQGKDHPLMRTRVTVPITTMTWLDEGGYYEYELAKGDQVHKYPYDTKYLASILPDPEIVTKTLRLPNARLLGNDTLDGRPAIVIEITNAKSSTETTSGKYWIDPKTNQLLQYKYVTTTTGGPQNGRVQSFVNRIALDELVALSAFPSDYFTFRLPTGAVLSGDSASIGSPAPEFSLEDVRTGKPVTLSSLRGKPVVILMWGTGCPPCLNTLPILQDLYYRTDVSPLGYNFYPLEADKDKSFISISSGSRDNLDTVRSFVEAHRYQWTFLHDASDSIMNLYAVNSLPTIFFIDKDGIVRSVHVGEVTDADITLLRAELEKTK